jgi:hypothetical protein
MQRHCDECGEPYEFQRRASRFCSTKCRTRATRRSAEAVDRSRFFVPDDTETDPVHILQQRRDAKMRGDDQALAYWMARWNALPPSVTSPNPENW